MRRFIFSIILLCFAFSLKAQKSFLSGYIKDLQSVYFFNNPIQVQGETSINTLTYNLIHNRLDFSHDFKSGLSFDIGIRNRIISGNIINAIPDFKSIYGVDNGIIDLSGNIISGKQWFLNTSVDRLFLDYSKDNFQIRVGRQRINWGVNLVWNPNDLFNAFNFIDFDYEERPGSDAVLISWYTSESSELDFAVKSDYNGKTTMAARYRFNYKDWDLQIIGGKDKSDIVFGGGCSGELGNISVRGEGSLFIPYENLSVNKTVQLSLSASVDYTFKNSLYLNGSFLINSSAHKSTTGVSILNPETNLSAKNLSFGKYELFTQISYPVSPILSVSNSLIINAIDLSSFISPAMTVSLQNNLEFMLSGQMFIGRKLSEYSSNGNIYALYGRLRLSF